VTQGGLAEQVGGYFLSRLKDRRDLRSVRFSTYVKNLASIVVNKRLGFRRRLVLSCTSWNRKRVELAGIGIRENRRVSVVSDPGPVRRFIERSGWFEASGGFLCEGWRAYPYSWELFRDRSLGQGRCLGVLEAGELQGMAAFVHDTRYAGTYLKLVFFDARDRETADALFDALFAYVRQNARDAGEIEVMLPPIDRVAGYCAAHGFVSWEQEEDFLVYELPPELLAESRLRS